MARVFNHRQFMALNHHCTGLRSRGSEHNFCYDNSVTIIRCAITIISRAAIVSGFSLCFQFYRNGSLNFYAEGDNQPPSSDMWRLNPQIPSFSIENSCPFGLLSIAFRISSVSFSSLSELLMASRNSTMPDCPMQG